MDARRHLFSDATVGDYALAVGAGVDAVSRAAKAAGSPFTGVQPHELAPLVDAVDLDAPLGSADDALAELEELYLRDAVWFHHPRYLAHLNCPVVLPALLGEAVLSAVNSSLDTWDQSAGATLLEQRLVTWTADRLGLGAAADGVFTSGGTQSNLQALLLARETRGPGRVLTSAASHFSVVTSARLLGLPAEAVVPVPTDDRHRLSVPHLLASLDEDVMAVVATAGTTDFGSIDPLPAVADACATRGTWLHVDAAYGCGLLASPTRRHLLAGIERADSVTVDFHKSFFQPVSSSALLVRDRAVLRHVTHHADYLNPVHARTPNQVDKSLQTTRRFDALKLWLTLRVMGADAVGELFDAVCDLAAEVWQQLASDPRFEVQPASALSTVVFRVRGSDEANLHARAAVSRRGEAVVAATRVGGRHHLKLTLLNPRTTVDDVAAVLDLLAGHAAAFDEERACA